MSQAAETLDNPFTLPSLDSPYRVTAEQRARFDRDGHVALSAVLSADELAACRDAVRRTVAASIAQHHALEDDVGAADRNWQFVNNLWTQSEGARNLVHARRLARIAATLLNVNRVRLYRDQSYFKGPGGAGTPWHQDGCFIPLATDAIVTAWIPLTDITAGSSPMTYASGSHRSGFLGLCPGGDAMMRRFEAGLRARGHTFETYDNLHAGDVAFHAAWTMHGTYANTTAHMREAVVIVYFADGACVVHDPPEGTPGAPHAHVRQIREHSRAISLPDLADGARAEGETVPILYDRGWDTET